MQSQPETTELARCIGTELGRLSLEIQPQDTELC